MTRQEQLLSALDVWRKKASEYARSDRIGHVFVRSFDLIGGAAKDGLEAESVRDLSEMFERDRDYAKQKDSKDLVPLTHAPRELVYGLMETFGAMIEVLADRRTEERYKTAEVFKTAAEQVLPEHPSAATAVTTPRRESDLLRLYHGIGASGQPTEGTVEYNTVKEEDETIASDSSQTLYKLPKDEEEVDQFSGLREGALSGDVSALEGEELMGKDRAAREKEEEAQRGAGTIQQAKRRRVSALSHTEYDYGNRSAPAPPHAADSRYSIESDVATASHSNSATQQQQLSLGSSYYQFVKSTGEYTCDVCSFTAGGPFKLAVHKRIHTGDRPFKCSFNSTCTSTFTTQSNLNQHLRNVHKVGDVRQYTS